MLINATVKRILSDQERESSLTLGLTVNGKAIMTKQYISKADAQTAPDISFAVPKPSTWPSPRTSMLPFLPGVVWPFVANYIGPAPPPGSGPHRYNFFLFEQPDSFDGKDYAPANGKPLGNWNRMRYDLDSWRKKAKLGDPLAVNYFVSNWGMALFALRFWAHSC